MIGTGMHGLGAAMCAIYRFILVAFLLVAGITTASADRRVALVIGNSVYQHTRNLPNPKYDAEAIAKLLREIGFAEVTLRTDLDYRGMREAVRVLGRSADTADIALVYYAGHGLELAGENYLAPTDARLVRDTDLEYEAVTLASVLKAVAGARRLTLVILDACRNNPLGDRMAVRDGATRSVTRGLGRIEPKGDVLVAYSARAGTLAEDGAGRHSPYADALLKHMATPGLDVRLMFGRVRDHVMAATRQRQEPYIYGSLGGTNAALVPTPDDPLPHVTAPPKAVPVAPAPRPEETKRVQGAEKSDEPMLSLVECCLAYCRAIGCNSPPASRACSPGFLGSASYFTKRYFFDGARAYNGTTISACQ